MGACASRAVPELGEGGDEVRTARHAEDRKALQRAASTRREVFDRTGLQGDSEAVQVLGWLYSLQEGRALNQSPTEILEAAIRVLEEGLGVKRQEAASADILAASEEGEEFTEWLESADPYAAQMGLFRAQKSTRRIRSRESSGKALGSQKIEVDKSNAAEYCKKTTVWAHQTNAPVKIQKEWGLSDGLPGDYIIVGPNDDAYMCNAELFESTYELLPGYEHKYVKTGTVLARKMSRDFMAETSTGVQRGKKGDYLVQDASGEQWTIDEKTFEETYDEVNAATQTRVMESLLAPAQQPGSVSLVLDKKMQQRSFRGDEDADEVAALLARATHWDFDVFALYEASKGHALLRLGTHFFQGHDLYTVLGIDKTTLGNFLGDVEAAYLPVPYHNSIHAADVLQSTNHFIVSTSMDAKFTVVDKFCMLVAAAGHDLGHPGTNNLFQVMAHTPFAVFYNDSHVLENFHVATMFQIMRRPERNIMSGWPRTRFAEARKMIIDLVLATDFAEHKRILGDFDKARRRGGSLDSAMKQVLANKSSQRGGSMRTEEDKPGSFVGQFGSSPEDRILIGMVTLKCADVGHPAKAWHLHERWTMMVTDEFEAQTSKEQQLGLPSSMQVSKVPHELAKSQLGFIKYLVEPLIRSYSEFHNNPRWVANVKTNLARWEKKSKEVPEGLVTESGAAGQA